MLKIFIDIVLVTHDFIGQETNAHLLNHIITSRKGFFSLGPVDILGQIGLCCGSLSWML